MRSLRLAVLLGVLGTSSGCIFVGFRTLESVDNQPLRNPVPVGGVVAEDELVLANGRRVRLRNPVRRLSDKIRKSNNKVDVVPIGIDWDGAIRADVFVKAESREFVCGTPYAKLIIIPLYKDRVFRYSRISVVE